MAVLDVDRDGDIDVVVANVGSRAPPTSTGMASLSLGLRALAAPTVDGAQSSLAPNIRAVEFPEFGGPKGQRPGFTANSWITWPA